MIKYLELLKSSTSTTYDEIYTFECNCLEYPEFDGTIDNIGTFFTNDNNGYNYHINTDNGVVIGREPNDVSQGQLVLDGDIKSVAAPAFRVKNKLSNVYGNGNHLKNFLTKGYYTTFTGRAPIEILNVDSVIPNNSIENYRGVLNTNTDNKIRMTVRLNPINTSVSQPDLNYDNAILAFGVFVNGNEGTDVKFRFNRFRLYKGYIPIINLMDSLSNSIAEQSRTTPAKYEVRLYDNLHHNMLNNDIANFNYRITNDYTINETYIENLTNESLDVYTPTPIEYQYINFNFASTIPTGQNLFTLENIFDNEVINDALQFCKIDKLNKTSTINNLTIETPFAEYDSVLFPGPFSLVVSFMFRSSENNIVSNSSYPNPFDVIVVDNTSGNHTLSIMEDNMTLSNYRSKDWVRLNYKVVIDDANDFYFNFQTLSDIIIRSNSTTDDFTGDIQMMDLRCELFLTDDPENHQSITADSLYQVNKERPIQINLKEDPPRNQYEGHIHSKTLYWMNPYGGFDSYRFIGRNDPNISIQRDIRSTGDSFYDGYMSSTDQINWRNKVRQRWELTSDYLTQDKRIWLEELYMSPQVFIYDENHNNFIPVNVLDNQFVRVNTGNQKLFQLKINIEASADRRTQQLLK